MAWHVLEHLAQPRDTLTGVRAALRPGGRLLLELPNIASLRATRQGEDWYGMEPAHHVAHYSPRALDALLRASGYVPEVVESVHPGTLLGGREAFGPRGLAFHAKETLRRARLDARAAPLEVRPAPRRRARSVVLATLRRPQLGRPGGAARVPPGSHAPDRGL